MPDIQHVDAVQTASAVSKSLDVSVVVVNYNGAHFIVGALQATRDALAASGLTYHIVVVDNASIDDSCALISEHLPDVQLERLAVGRGFSAGNNVGASRSPDSTFVLFINPDAWLLPGTIKKMVEFLRRNPRYAAVAPAELAPDDQLRRTWWPVPTPEQFVISTLASPLPGLRRGRPARDKIDVPYLPGFCLLVRRTVLHSVGGWDEQYPLYSEDVDLGFRIRKMGYRQAVLLDAPAVHIGSAASGGMAPAEKDALLARARVLFWYKHFTARARLAQGLMRRLVPVIERRAPGMARRLRTHLMQPVPGRLPDLPPVERRDSTGQNAPRVTVVIPTYNRLDSLLRVLPSYVKADLVDEILLVLDGVAEVPPVLADRLSTLAGRVRCITTGGKRLGQPRCRMLGVQQCRTDWLLFGEDDVELEQDYVLRLAAHIRDDCHVVAAGRILGGSWVERKDELRHHADWRVGSPLGSDWTDADFSRKCPGVHDVPFLHSIALMPRQLALELGFEESLYQGNQYREETDFYVRARHAGYRLLWDNEAVCYHLRDLSNQGGHAMGRYRRLYWVIVNNWRFMTKNAAILRQDYGVPSAKLLAIRFSLHTIRNVVAGDARNWLKRSLGIRAWRLRPATRLGGDS